MLIVAPDIQRGIGPEPELHLTSVLGYQFRGCLDLDFLQREIKRTVIDKPVAVGEIVLPLLPDPALFTQDSGILG